MPRHLRQLRPGVLASWRGPRRAGAPTPKAPPSTRP